jgi:hypothetical protein
MAAFAAFWPGLMPTEVANAGGERRIYETPALDLPVCLRVTSWPTEPCVHDQETDVPGLLRVGTGI